jgi:uncharacterized protein YtpQ (UPF0354 family)
MSGLWRSLLLAPDLTKESLRESVRLALAESSAIESASAIPADPLGLQVRTVEGRTLTVMVDNLFADASRSAPEERERLLSEFMSAVIDSAETCQPSLDEVIPLIKSAESVATLPVNDIANEHLVADLHVVYAFYRPGLMDYVHWHQLDLFARPRSEFRQIALANLRARLPPKLGTHGNDETFTLVADGNHEASMILLDEVWEQLAPSIRGDIVVCVVTRDVCLVTGTGIPGGVESLITARDRCCASGPSNFISKTLLRRRVKGWIAFQEPL